MPVGPDGTVSTWREDHPHEERLSRTEYDRTKRPLQIEPLELQNRVKETGQAMRSCRIPLQDATPDSVPTSVAGDYSEVAR
ncbi:MAG: polyphosphate kinase [Pseudonocardiales bacterium]|nr:polyphosphate kinase [Pseudonocardiales bacterium]